MSKTRETSLNMKFKSSVFTSSDDEYQVNSRSHRSPEKFSQNTKEKAWNTYYSSANDTKFGARAYR